MLNSPEIAVTPNPGLRDVLQVIRDGKKSVLLVGTTFILGAIGLAILLPPTYSSTATVLPAPEVLSVWTPTGQTSPANLVSLQGTPNSAAGILQSRAVAHSMIKRFELNKVYNRRSLGATEAVLADHVRINASPLGTVSINVTDVNPQRAAAMANAFIDELDRQDRVLARMLAIQRHAVFQDKLVSERVALSDAEKALKNTQEKLGIVNLTGQVRASLRSIAELRTSISMLEVEQQSLSLHATADNSELRTVQARLEALRGALNRLAKENGDPAVGVNVSNNLPLPSASLEYLRAYREAAFHRMLVDLLSRQLETATMDEAKGASRVRVLEFALCPDDEAGPPRFAIAILSSLLGLALGIAQLLVRQGIRRRRPTVEEHQPA